MLTDFPPLELLGPVTATLAPEALAQVRLEGGLALPASFRAFLQTYGYGLLCNRLILFVPLDECCDDDLRFRSPALAEFFREGLEDDLFEHEPDGSPELVGRLVPFGISEDGHFFAWDPREPTGPQELMIYAVGSKFLSVTRAAPTLYDLVAGCLDPQQVRRILGPGYRPLPATFRPAVPYLMRNA